MFKIDKNKAYRPNACLLDILMHHYLYIKSKNINYMFLRHCERHLQPPESTIFIAFAAFTLENCLYRELSV